MNKIVKNDDLRTLEFGQNDIINLEAFTPEENLLNLGKNIGNLWDTSESKMSPYAPLHDMTQ